MKHRAEIHFSMPKTGGANCDPYGGGICKGGIFWRYYGMDRLKQPNYKHDSSVDSNSSSFFHHTLYASLENCFPSLCFVVGLCMFALVVRD
jgi:hypothetical protein